ncbi:MAG TPA: efflux transporter outer membrane subunit [Caulobacteraceae bacterium]|jgi:NodT family efflux transporter outer membrane factor (OMF) lipoprotein
MRSFPVLLALAAMAGCTVGPNYHQPTLPTPPAYLEEGSAPGVTSASPDVAAWWSLFGDATLNALETRAAAGNLDVATAVSKIREARQQEVIAGAAAWPQINASGSVNNTLLSKNAGFSQLAKSFGGGAGGSSGSSAGGSSGGGLGLPGTDFTTYTAGFDASWEFDLFGQTRRAEEAARGRSAAQEWTLRDTEVSVAAEVAVDYLTLRALQQQIIVAQHEQQRQQALFDLVNARRQAGFATQLEVSQQQTSLAAAQAETPTLQAEARGEVHALGVLLGDPPEALDAELTPAAATPAPPPSIPVGLPSELLRRRPDVREAERNLAAATADVGVAVGDLYPKINLTGSADLVSESLSTLLSGNSIQTAATGAIVQTLFNGGRTRANIEAYKERRIQAYDAYQTAVLTALQDVEDALSRYGGEVGRNARLRAQATAAEAAYQTADERYQAGLSDFINVLNTEAAVLTAGHQVAQSDGQVDVDLVSVYKALGGGWEGSPARAAAAPSEGDAGGRR